MSTTKAKSVAKRPAKPKADPQNKLLVTAVKKTINTNTVLPILDDIYFYPGFAQVSDLENFVTVPFDMPGVPETGICIPAKMFCEILEIVESPAVQVDKKFGVAMEGSGRKVKVMGEDPDNYPLAHKMGDSASIVGKLTESDMALLETALCFISTDDLRPAMTGVFIEATAGNPGSDKPGNIVATDAHRMYFHPLSGPITSSFIMPSKTAKILLALGGEWEIVMSADGLHAYFRRSDGSMVTTRVIDARFPDYKAVLPEGAGLVKLVASPDFLLKELKNAIKFANRSTNQVTFGLNGKFTVASQDVDFSFEYQSEVENKSQVEFWFHKKYPRELLYKDEVVRIKEDLGPIVKLHDHEEPVNRTDLKERDPYLNIAFNAKFLQEIIHKLPKDTAVEFKMWASTKCAIINEHFLVMPLMLNQ